MVNTQNPLKFLLFFGLIFSCGDIFADTTETILNFGFGEPIEDGEVSNGFFQTSDDGDASNSGNQTTDVSFLGFLDSPFADISLFDSGNGGASISFSNVQLNNDTQIIKVGNGINVINSTTSGGEFRLYGESGLLLAGEFGDSVFSVNQGIDGVARTGNFFGLSTGGTTFTDGDLLPFLDPNSGQITLTLSNIETNGISGLQVIGDTIQPFTAALSGQIEASPNAVPEPTSIPLLVIVVSLLAKSRNRRSDS